MCISLKAKIFSTIALFFFFNRVFQGLHQTGLPCTGMNYIIALQEDHVMVWDCGLETQLNRMGFIFISGFRVLGSVSFTICENTFGHAHTHIWTHLCLASFSRVEFISLELEKIQSSNSLLLGKCPIRETRSSLCLALIFRTCSSLSSCEKKPRLL